jgi:magnesium-transporting ATPase (P-type)
MDAAGVVPDDLLVLSQGTKVAGDGTVIRGIDLQVDESALTGESFPVPKTESEPIFAGTVGRRMARSPWPRKHPSQANRARQRSGPEHTPALRRPRRQAGLHIGGSSVARIGTMT